MSELIDRYWVQYGVKKASADREKSILVGIRSELGHIFVRDMDGVHIQGWVDNLTGKRGLAENTAVRHFNVTVTRSCLRSLWPIFAKLLPVLHSVANWPRRSLPSPESPARFLSHAVCPMPGAGLRRDSFPRP